MIKYIFKNIWLLFAVILPSNGQEFIDKIVDNRPSNTWHAIYGVGLPNLTYVGLKNQMNEKSSIDLTYGFLPLKAGIAKFNMHSLASEYNYYLSPKESNSFFICGSISVSNFASNSVDGSYLVYSVSPQLGFEHINEESHNFYSIRLGFLKAYSSIASPLNMFCGGIGFGFQIGK